MIAKKKILFLTGVPINRTPILNYTIDSLSLNQYDSNIIEIKRKSDEFNEACKAFSKAHGPTMDLIRDFTDFHLLKLLPREGVMVLGFAKAFALSGLDLQITKHLSES